MTENSRSEMKVQIVQGIFTVTAAFVLAVSGYIAGKSDLSNIVELHRDELSRQKEILNEQHEREILAVNLESWTQQAKLMQLSREALMANLGEIEDDIRPIYERIINTVQMERNFDDIGLIKFIRDNGSPETYEQFVDVMNKRSEASANLQMHAGRLIHTGAEMPLEQYAKKTAELTELGQKEALASAEYFGFIRFHSMDSLSETAQK